MKKLHIWITVLAILFSMATIVDAKTYRVENSEAFASWPSTYIHVTKYDNGIWPASTTVYVAQSASNNIWYGIYYTMDNVFDMDSQLNTATLLPVEIRLQNLSGAFIKNIRIQAQWTGTDSIQSEKYSHVKIYERNATATGSEDEVDMGQTNDATLKFYEGTYR